MLEHNLPEVFTGVCLSSVEATFGSVVPSGIFEYCTTSPGSCDQQYPDSDPSSSSPALKNKTLLILRKY